MEVSALRYSGGIGLHGRSPLLRLQSDERLIALIRRGNSSAFEVLVSRYHSRLLAFCRHLLGSKEDAEDVLQEVFAAAFNAILGDDRPINVRPWLYRIARNRSLNHLRRIQAIGVDSMDVHFSEYGATTADKVHDREQFRLLVGDIHSLPETQRTALVLREMDALSYEQIAEAMDTTVPGVKSLLVRARISLAEAAEARQLSCDEVRLELGEVAEGLRKRPPALVRRHLKTCTRCSTFQSELKQTSKVLAALIPIGPMAMLRKLLILHIGHSAGTGSGATAGAAGASTATTATATGAGTTAGAGGLAAGPAAAVASTAGGGAAFGSAGGLLSAGAGAIATKAAAGLAAAALVTAGAVEATHATHHASGTPIAPTQQVTPVVSGGVAPAEAAVLIRPHTKTKLSHLARKKAADSAPSTATHPLLASTSTTSLAPAEHPAGDTTKKTTTQKPDTTRTQVQTDPTVLSSSSSTSSSTGSGEATDPTTTSGSTSSSSSSTTSSGSSGSCSPSSGTTTTSTTTTPDPPTTITTSTTPTSTTPQSPPTTTTTTPGGTTTPTPPPSTASCPPPSSTAPGTPGGP